MKDESRKIGDMPAEQFREYGHKLVDWAADFLAHIEDYPVTPEIVPGDLTRKLPKSPPAGPDEMDDIMADVDRIIMPGMTHWNHPAFHAYFNSSASGPGILGEFLAALFNVNGMLWKSCPAATELEQVTVDWMRQMLGLPDGLWGIVFEGASMSSMIGLAAAREAADLDIRANGMAGRSDLSRLRVYCSEQAHSSIDKAAITVGFGLEGLRKIPVDRDYRMIPEKLIQAIDEDRRDGWLPTCVIATVGTTSCTSIDPVEQIADICKRENVWLHVDAAHAGIAAIVPEMRHILSGCDRADSITVNPHKWMFVPLELSLFFCRRPDIVRCAFSIVPEYLRTDREGEVEDFMNYGITLGRRFRSLKLWMVIRYFGVEGIISRLREHIRIAGLVREWIDNHPQFERLAPVPLSTVCFRADPGDLSDPEALDRFNERLLDRINSTHRIFLSHAKLDGRFALRIVFSHLRQEERHAHEAWQLIQDCFREERDSSKE